MALVLLAGSLAEDLLLGSYGAGGYVGDVEILRIGLGWLSPLTRGQQTDLARFVEESRQLTRNHQEAIQTRMAGGRLWASPRGADT
jgi:hypothetical protein